MQESESLRIPQFDQRVSRWRATGGQFMRLGVPLGGWVLVQCERCGRHFPTREWQDNERPVLFICSFDCLPKTKRVPLTLTETNVAGLKAKANRQHVGRSVGW